MHWHPFMQTSPIRPARLRALAELIQHVAVHLNEAELARRHAQCYPKPPRIVQVCEQRDAT
jgi:hypothetical protein